MLSERRRSTDHRDSGVVAVETAIVSMFLVTLLFGIVESSFLFKDWHHCLGGRPCGRPDGRLATQDGAELRPTSPQIR